MSLPYGYKPVGENMVPALLGERQRRTTPLFWDWRRKDAPTDCWPRWAVRDGDWKLVFALPSGPSLRALLTNVLADRPNRFEPRVKKRRLNHYGWLMKPHAEIKRLIAKGVTEV